LVDGAAATLSATARSRLQVVAGLSGDVRITVEKLERLVEWTRETFQRAYLLTNYQIPRA
jgi:hypothetical protein